MKTIRFAQHDIKVMPAASASREQSKDEAVKLAASVQAVVHFSFNGDAYTAYPSGECIKRPIYYGA